MRFGNIQFVKNRKKFYLLTVILLLAGIITVAIRGFNWDIDFVGGTVMQIDIGKKLDNTELDKIASIVEKAIGDNVSNKQIAGQSSEEVVIKTKVLTTEQRKAAFDALAAEYSLAPEALMSSENVDAVVGKDLRNAAIMSTIIAVVLILVYIIIRFELFTGISAILCLLQDIMVMIIFYSILQIPMNTTFIAAILTILGFSINDTIVTFDRVRENIKVHSDKPFDEIVNISINQTISRSLITSLTVLMTIGMIYILGVTEIKNFALPLIIGILAGVYSSVCLASSIWVSLRMKFGKVKA